MDTATTVVRESAGSRNFLWGFLTVVFGVALVRGHLGATTTSGRIAVDVFAGGLFLAAVAGWIWFNRHPARLEIGRDAIVHIHRGQPSTVRLPCCGELVVSRTFIGGKHPVAFLSVAGSEGAIPIGNFNLPKVKQACAAHGWVFAEGSL